MHPAAASGRYIQAVHAACLIACLQAGAAYAGEPMLRNWFNDPFFQIADGLPGCPAPLGPLLSETEMKSESHARAERGTSCWLAGSCSEPNAYRYDAGIARDIRDRVSVPGDASLWITVKRRFVWLEGCIADARQAEAVERELKSVPQVERVLVDVMTGTQGSPPYRTAPVQGR